MMNPWLIPSNNIKKKLISLFTHRTLLQSRWHAAITRLHVNTHCLEKRMKLCTAVQEGWGYKDTLRAHRYFAPLAKYFTVCITYQPSLVCCYFIVRHFFVLRKLLLILSVSSRSGRYYEVTVECGPQVPKIRRHLMYVMSCSCDDKVAYTSVMMFYTGVMMLYTGVTYGYTYRKCYVTRST